MISRQLPAIFEQFAFWKFFLMFFLTSTFFHPKFVSYFCLLGISGCFNNADCSVLAPLTFCFCNWPLLPRSRGSPSDERDSRFSASSTPRTTQLQWTSHNVKQQANRYTSTWHQKKVLQNGSAAINDRQNVNKGDLWNTKPTSTKGHLLQND